MLDHPTPAPKLLLTECARFANDEIDFPPGAKIDHIEQRLLAVSFQRRRQFDLVLVLR